MTRAAHDADPFGDVLAGTGQHRREHSCWAYPFRDGPALGVLAGAMGATRILELGTALGYTACWFAHASPMARVDTIERDPDHVRLARRNIDAFGFTDRVNVIHGDFADALRQLAPGYDLAFFDGYAPSIADLNKLRSLLRPRGVLISANLNLEGGEAVRTALADPHRWLTAPMLEDGRTHVSIAIGREDESCTS
ncbi:MAG: class I SAM-dependent methyltransferase [Pseudomonadota bacterium]|nr:class I SAM-dependent methyltransferase [Pseudomonadota bacterium]